MKPQLAVLTLALLGIGATGCAGASKAVTSSAAKTASEATTIGNNSIPQENFKPNTFDGDDNPIRFFGHDATGATRQTIATLVAHYYKLAATVDGTKACQLVDSITAEAVPEDYGQLPTLRGKTCAVVLSKLFKQEHLQLTKKGSRLKVVGIRVEGGKALALLRFTKTTLPNYIAVRREGGTWKIWDLFDAGMP